ncbi:hypothetical protein [Sphingobacterium multivorum]|uniref:Uncharacterized protein n=1 Tax=Sphingobacterium multivorum TaxID=28454 RepID=A0A654D4E4_SPHMU|nr:hypothetical protein [Sphingobacterium multivorum]VXC99401.1 conserved hypothetical protein [Sphingobacterium multivorum]
MIQSNELRIGNYVASDHFKDRDVIVKVRLIGQEQAIVEHPNGLTEPMLYQGEMRAIKLTEEILLKCGFDIESVPYHCINGNVVLYYSQGDFLYKYTGTEIKYLHQLQNLFYALTGKELEVNL